MSAQQIFEMTDAKNDWTGRMDNMERRQDERHDQNTRSLQSLSDKLDPICVQMRQICGDENYRGRMGLAEDDIRELNRVVKAIDKTIAKWSGGMIVAVGLIEVVSKLFEHYRP